jgi:hypothetical protein
MRMKRIFWLISLFFTPFSCYSSNLDLLLSGGAAISKTSNNTYVGINQYMLNAYQTNSRTLIQPLLGIGLAHTFINFSRPISVSVGLSGYYADFGKIHGTEYPFINDGIYDSLDYKFQTQAWSVMAESRLAYTQYNWQPYVLAGAGASWNHLYSYSETPSISSQSAAASPYPFSNHGNSAFAYEFGVGIQKQIYSDLNHHLQYFLDVDYRYMNFGKGALGASLAQTTGDRIHIPNLETQALLLSLKISLV